ncbi:MAG: SDR family oxidoreductase [Neptuniibacter sp.]
MHQSTILIAGCGDVGSKLGTLLLQQGHKVIGLRRNINQLPPGIQGISTDLTQFDALSSALKEIQTCDILVYATAASQHNEDGYQAAYVDGVTNVLNALPVKPKHLFFTSSTSVYHQNDHEWVDEKSPCNPQSFSGKIMLQAEKQIFSSDIPASVVRFSGIYGPGRTRLIQRVKGGDGAPAEPLQYSNRIHRDDCAGVLNHLIDKVLSHEPVENCYLATDDDPVSLHEITYWLAKEMGVEILTETFSRRTGSKRCSNRQLKESGYQMKYPCYQEGYSELLSKQ